MAPSPARQADLGELSSIGSCVDFEAGTVIFLEGDEHDSIYFVGDGQVRLDMQTTHGQRRTVLTAGPGDLLAWSSLVSKGVMTSTAIAIDPVQAVVFNINELNALLHRDYRLGYHFMRRVAKAISQRLNATRLQLLDLFN